MALHARTQLDPDAYLAEEREAATRHEYLDGEMLALAGASLRHSLLLTNALTALHGGDCFAVPNDLRVGVPDRSLYAYPDLVAWCGEPEMEDKREDTLTNPVLIAEVLSASTEAFCRGEKFARYRRIPSLACYLLIAQDRVRVERYLRAESGGAEEGRSFWRYDAFEAIDDSVDLPPLGCVLEVADVYRGTGVTARG